MKDGCKPVKSLKNLAWPLYTNMDATASASRAEGTISFMQSDRHGQDSDRWFFKCWINFCGENGYSWRNWSDETALQFALWRTIGAARGRYAGTIRLHLKGIRTALAERGIIGATKTGWQFMPLSTFFLAELARGDQVQRRAIRVMARAEARGSLKAAARAAALVWSQRERRSSPRRQRRLNAWRQLHQAHSIRKKWIRRVAIIENKNRGD